MAFVPIENDKTFVRDTSNRAVLNTDVSSLERYYIQRKVAKQRIKEQEEVKEEEAKEEEEQESEEVFEIEIDDVTYFATDEENGILYEVGPDGDVGKQVGIIKDGEPIFE